jgi:hypothetical protein
LYLLIVVGLFIVFLQLRNLKDAKSWGYVLIGVVWMWDDAAIRYFNVNRIQTADFKFRCATQH